MQHSTNFRVNNFKDILADKDDVNDHNNENHHDNKDNGNNDFDDYKNDDNNDDDDVCIALAYFDRKLNRSQYTHCENYKLDSSGFHDNSKVFASIISVFIAIDYTLKMILCIAFILI